MPIKIKHSCSCQYELLNHTPTVYTHVDILRQKYLNLDFDFHGYNI